MYRKFEGEADRSHHGPAPNRLYSTAHNMRTWISEGKVTCSVLAFRRQARWWGLRGKRGLHHRVFARHNSCFPLGERSGMAPSATVTTFAVVSPGAMGAGAGEGGRLEPRCTSYSTRANALRRPSRFLMVPSRVYVTSCDS